MSERHEGKRWVDVKGGPHDGSELELARETKLGAEVLIVSEEGGLQVVEVPHLPGVSERPPGPLYVLRGFGLEFVEHHEEKPS